MGIRKIHAICWGIVTFLLLGGLFFYGIKTTKPQSSFVNLPDSKHLHQLYNGDVLEEAFKNPVSSLNGITIFLDQKTVLTDNTALHFEIRDVATKKILREGVQQVGRLDSDGQIYLNFDTLRGISERQLVLSIEFSEVSNKSIYIKYQSDATKYPDGKTTINGNEKQGSIGFLLFEKPSVAEIVLRWVDRHGVVLIGVLIVISGILVAIFRRGEKKRDVFWNEISEHIRVQKNTHFVFIGIIVAITIAVYCPASKEFFVQDDISIILRAKEFSHIQPLLLLTNQPYIVFGEKLSTATPFYRPVSYSLYPAVLYSIFGLNFKAFFLSNLILFAITAVGLYILSTVILRSQWVAFVVSLIWVTHPTKLAFIDWWSSSQDILAGFFSVGTLLAYIWHQASPRAAKKALVLVLFAMALLSKEYAVLIIPIIFLLDFLCREQNINSENFLIKVRQCFERTGEMLSPILIILGIYVVIRIVALGDPSLPMPTQKDHSYDFSFSIPVFMRNIVAYSNWVVEGDRWPNLLPWVEMHLRPLMVSLSDYQPPYTPSLIFIMVICIGAFFLNKDSKKRALFAVSWFLLFLAPILFLSHEQQPRWLAMPIYGLCLLVILEIQHVTGRRKVIKGIVFSALASLFLISAFINARDIRKNSTHELAQQALSVIAQYREQEKVAEPGSRIIFVDFPYDMRGTINQSLLQLVSSNEFSGATYVDTLNSEELNEQSIIILRK